ncbi:MAG: ankyrin repeat domain-containing protein, partial [Verrucomicrobiales bacterium]|nr:ankyrin repeat domain-containing protein [Verrucomicrobiales bacterium]
HKVTATVPLHDPTHPAFKRGRIAFNTARASTTRSFSCASCHPDGHTDQLLWVLKTPVVTGGDQIMPRSTMPLRGLRDTAPFHWDGIPGDPYGGINSANTRSHVEPNSSIDEPESTTRHVIDGGLASTMLLVGDTSKNDEGKEGFLTAAERDDMSKFLLNITFPPAQRRAYTNELSDRAKDGFEHFHIKGDPQGTPGGNHCGNCHRMPFWVSTNTPGSGMDAPTWRGAYDRFLILPQGRLNIIDFDFYRRVAEQGNDERSIWQFSWSGRRYFDPVWDMVLEGSTGYSGSFARQVTVNQQTAKDSQTHNLLDALERSAAESAVVLHATGVLIDKNKKTVPVSLQFNDGAYASTNKTIPRARLLKLANDGRFVGTFTARHGAKDDYDHPQPALWTLTPIHAQTGAQQFPVVVAPENSMTINARHLDDHAHIIVDGRRVPGTVTKNPDNENITLHLEHLPENGIHFLQVQNPGGLVSNDFIFFSAADEQSAIAARNRANPDRLPNALGEAVEAGNLERVKRLVAGGAPVNARRESNGTTPLAAASLRGDTAIARFLLENKARPNHTNRDRNAPLHIAAFMCRTEIVELLLKHGASVTQKNARDESPIQSVTPEWNDGLARFYTAIANGSGFEIDLEEIQKLRPKIAERLKSHRKE